MLQFFPINIFNNKKCNNLLISLVVQSKLLNSVEIIARNFLHDRIISFILSKKIDIDEIVHREKEEESKREREGERERAKTSLA